MPELQAERKGIRVLICEDDPLVGEMIATVLDGAGYVPEGPCESALNALEHAIANRPAVALVDIGLTGPIDGITLAAELDARGIPVIFLTGDYNRAVEERNLVADILIKPVPLPVLLGSIENVLGRAAA